MASSNDSPNRLDTTSSLEVALDQAIARRFATASERGGKKRRNTPTAKLAAVRSDMAHTPTDKLGTGAALAVPSRETALMKPAARLRWRGIEVSDEFQEYAARVSRGEELEPYRGAVLSRPCAEFPWSVASERLSLPPPSLPPALPSSRASQRPSLAPVSVPLFEAPQARRAAEAAVYPERGRALKTTLWLAGAVSSIVAALGVGAGATSTDDNEFDARAPEPAALAQEPALAPKPAPAAARDEALASSLDVAPELLGGIGERQLASLAAANEKAAADAKLAAAAPTRSPTPRPLVAPAAPLPARAASKPRIIAPPVSAPASSASRLTIPPPGPASVGGELSHGVVTSARPTERGSGLDSNESGSLFSDRAPF